MSVVIELDTLEMVYIKDLNKIKKLIKTAKTKKELDDLEEKIEDFKTEYTFKQFNIVLNKDVDYLWTIHNDQLINLQLINNNF